MGLDIYNLLDKTEFLGSVDSLNSIENALIIFNSKTGLTIDEYGTTRLYLDHIRLLQDLIKDKSNDWSNIFKRAIDSEIGLVIEGD